MAAGNREIIASTIFVPVDEGLVVDAYMFNISGSLTEPPTRVSTGHYRCLVPGDLDELKTSITHHATNPAGETRDVSIVLTRTGPQVRVDIFIRDPEAFLVPGVLSSEDHLDVDTVITGAVLATILNTSLTTTEGTEDVNVNFTFAGKSTDAANPSTVVFELFVDGVALPDSSGTGTRSLLTADLQSGGINRLVTIVGAGVHTFEIRAAIAVGADFGIAALTSPERNHGSLVTTRNSQVAADSSLTDDASFVECTFSRLPLGGA